MGAHDECTAPTVSTAAVAFTLRHMLRVDLGALCRRFAKHVQRPVYVDP